MPLPIRLEDAGTPNLTQLRIGGLTVFYSYFDPIGFMADGKVVTRDGKELSATSKKHITRLDSGDTSWRQALPVFLENLEAAMKKAMTSGG